MQFSIGKEEGPGSVSSSSAGHVRIWGSELNALPSPGAPRCCQARAGDGDPPQARWCSRLPKMCLRHRWAAPPPARGLTHGKASQTGICSWEPLLGEMGSTAGTTPAPRP